MAGADGPFQDIVHLRHPHPVSWPDIMSQFSSVLNLPIVDYPSWISAFSTVLDRVDASRAKYAKLGLSLLDFFQSNCTSGDAVDSPVTENNGLSILMGLGERSMRYRALQNSGVMQLGAEDVRKWVEYWRRIGTLALPSM